MKLFRSDLGVYLLTNETYIKLGTDWDELICTKNLHQQLAEKIKKSQPEERFQTLPGNLLPPIGHQEVWASGVTYLRSRSARMEESQAAGGSNFYDKVYEAARPELFFKAAAHRVKGHLESVRIRRDSQWNVPEPELTLLFNPLGSIIGYTIGNDMSSRDIEGENPLYLPQAKTYNGSCALGPCVYISDQPLSPTTEIELEVIREGKTVFSGAVAISQIKRSFEELGSYLFQELNFPHGCYLMTGTGIVPNNDFTLVPADEIRIHIPPIGTLINTVAE
ncbi:fumarylacetoacetate hydrolase family protein [Robiginitalea sp.]|nr:fumarylacetoacetate hydrolase family protein [Robiginitalea sp.]